MTNISKRKLPDKYVKKLAKQFVVFLRGSASENIFSSFFTESEQIMFIKRLAIILMIDGGYSKYRIAKTLNVSELTVLRLARKYDQNEFDAIVKKTKTKTFNSKQFWQVVDVLLRAGLPPMVGPGRWNGLQPMVGTRKK